MTKKILRIRPGHLANFSGGAGYMPFVLLFTIPASFIATCLSHAIVHFVARRMKSQEEEPREGYQAVDIAEFLRYSRRYFGILLVISIIVAIIFFVAGIQMVYGNKFYYSIPTLLLTVGPFASLLIATKYLFQLTISQGLARSNYVESMIVYLISMTIFCTIGWVMI